MSDKIFSISEAARYLGVFSLTLRNWEKKGLIKSFRTPGRHRRFRKSDLDKIIGVGGTKERLKESIRKLEEIEFEDSHKQTIDKIITCLKKMSEDV